MYREKKKYGQDPTIIMRSKTTFQAPLKWRHPRRVFTCSWSDFFIEEADAWRDEAWAVIRQTPQHTYMILTKRPERIVNHLPLEWPWPNVWMGVSVEDQARADERIPWLLNTPATVRFLSVEPLLSAIDLRRYFRPWGRLGVHLVIVGGESGGPPDRALVYRNAPPVTEIRRRPVAYGPWHIKPAALGWVRALRDSCLAAGVSFHFKQWGGPTSHSGGRELDGQTWDEFPAA